MDSMKDIISRQVPETATSSFREEISGRTTQGRCEKHDHDYDIIHTTYKYKHGGKIKEIASDKCPRCEQERMDEFYSGQIKEVDRVTRYSIGENIKKFGIPKRYKSIDIEKIVPDNKDQAYIIERCVKYAESYQTLKDLGSSLVFTGKPGTGKTLIALSLVRHLIKTECETTREKLITSVKSGEYDPERTHYFENHDGVYVNTYDLFSEIKSTYNKNSSETEMQVMNKYTNTSILVIDEVGAQVGSDYEMMLMFRIINKRYENMKPTFIISNLSEKDLSDYIGERTIDRFHENYGSVFVFNWASHRRKENV